MLKLARLLIGRVQIRGTPWCLLLGAVILTCVGAAFVRSSHSMALAGRHVVFGAAGSVVFLLLAFMDYRHLSVLAVPLYALGLMALAGLPLFGHTVNYARRWYDLGFFMAQPSEPMKYILVIVLADYWRFPGRMDRLRDLPAPLVLTILPMALIAQQPDVGTALLFPPVFAAMAFVGGVRLRNLLLLAGVGGVLLLGAWFTPGVLKDYQKQRIIGFIDPAQNRESPAAYNAEQAMTGIEAGGLTGRGWGRGVLNQLGRIPERHTDFIFPVISEEWGFVRTAPLVCLYLLVVVLLAQTTKSAWEPFGRLLVAGVATVFGFQALLNMAISLRLAPITGLTLPLVSYGGSSLISTYAGLGLAASTYLHKKTGIGVDGPAG
jgi:rod shape determining protein RodA